MTTQKQIDSIKTREQKYKDEKYDAMYISQKLVKSPAYNRLTGVSAIVYSHFLRKRRMLPFPHKPGKSKKDFYIANDGEIQFTYQEAEGWGITRPRFTRAIDQLVEFGFIDITRAGSGLQKDVSLYAISNRWEKYGTDEFVVKKRQKRKEHYGFQKGHKKISTNKNVT